MPNPTFLALEGSDATVVLVSIVLVFAMLIALCLIISLEGRFFDRGRKKPEAKADKPAPKAAAAASDAVPAEVVAAIAAAVSTVLGEGAVVRGIRRVSAPAGSRRGAWGDAAVRELTTPFV